MAAEPARQRRLLAAIIAGGRALRFGGQIKALLEVDGLTILEHQLAVLSPRVDEVVVSANQPEAFAGCGLRVIVDHAAGVDFSPEDQAERSGGPMLGIAAALAATGAEWLLVVGSDMPFVSGALLDLLLARIERDPRDQLDAVVPWVGGYAEPLLALYAARCAPVLRRHIAEDRRSLNRLLRSDELQVARVPEPELRTVDPELRSLVNINRPSELEALSRS